MNSKQWLILPPSNVKFSQREKEPNTARVRAHVARVTHARRKSRVSKTNINGKGEDTTEIDENHWEDGRENTLSPRSIVDNAKKEPFQVWSIDLLDKEHELVNIYVNKFQRQFYGNRPNTAAFSWFRDVVFPQAIQNPVVFRCGVLGVAAVLKAQFRQDLDAMSQDVQSLALLRHHFTRHPSDCSDAAIIMCIFRSLLDEWQGTVEASWTHLLAATQMIRQRGGPASFKDNTAVTIIANCYDYRTRGYMKGTLMAYMIYPSPTHDASINSSDQEFAVVREELVQFLHNAEQLSFMQQLTGENSRYSIFQPGSMFHAVMTAPHRVLGNYPYRQTYATFGMSVLLHLNAALWDFRRDLTLSQLFLDDLFMQFTQNQLHIYISVEGLAHLLMQPTSHNMLRTAHFNRLWKVGRLLNIAKHLSATGWHQLWNMLLSYLALEDPDLSIVEWEEDLRFEIDSAPSTKLVMSVLEI